MKFNGQLCELSRAGSVHNPDVQPFPVQFCPDLVRILVELVVRIEGDVDDVFRREGDAGTAMRPADKVASEGAPGPLFSDGERRLSIRLDSVADVGGELRRSCVLTKEREMCAPKR